MSPTDTCPAWCPVRSLRSGQRTALTGCRWPDIRGRVQWESCRLTPAAPRTCRTARVAVQAPAVLTAHCSLLTARCTWLPVQSGAAARGLTQRSDCPVALHRINSARASRAEMYFPLRCGACGCLSGFTFGSALLRRITSRPNEIEKWRSTALRRFSERADIVGNDAPRPPPDASAARPALRLSPLCRFRRPGLL